MDVSSPGETGPPLTVGAVICTHLAERLDQLVEAVGSVERQTRPPDQLLVVVDGPEELAAAVRDALPGRSVHCSGESVGVASARTRGARLLETDVVVYLDDDAVAEPDWVARLVEPLADPGVIGVSGRSLPVFEGPRPAWLPEEFLWTVGCSYRGMPEQRAVVRNVYGGCAALRRSVLLQLGGFDPETGYRAGSAGGGEEADFCVRATRETGGTFVFDPAAVIRHRVPPQRLSLRYYLRRSYAEGVVKAQLAGRLASASLAPERSFARALPRAMLRALRTPGERARAGGLVAATVAVLCGLAVGRLRRGGRG